ncbi:MAG: AAA family ATPase [Gammaproteobacteria bacterium]|nr:AAA family ATPase [Gammaproteobacteria bacterium]
MKFSEVIAAARALVEHNGRVSLRAMRREFELDDDTLADLVEELVEVLGVALLEDGRILIAAGGEPSAATPATATPTVSPAPVRYTPAHLSERIRAEQAALEARGGSGERKIVTALFADLKGSTALIEGLDPEEARALLDPALQLMMDAVHAYEGYVAQVLGDGILALFGAPLAHEDHAQRALNAALRLRDAVRDYGAEVRVGINTGTVVVRAIDKGDLRTDYVPVGHSTNLAARMEQLAEPGAILVTAHTHAYARGWFEFHARGAMDVKGVAEPVEVFELVAASGARSRLDAAVARGLTRFVGREPERQQLLRVYEEVCAGRGQIMAVVGEPGLGKSRLFHEFARGLPDDCRVLGAHPVSHGRGTAYLAVIELLRNWLGIGPDADDASRLAALDRCLAPLGADFVPSRPYLERLLDVGQAPASWAQIDPELRRQRTLDAVKRVFLHESTVSPLVILVEDLHWLDGESQRLFDLLADGIGAARVLLLVNYRPEYQHTWTTRTYYNRIRLAPLVGRDARALLDDLLGTAPALDDAKAEILARTEGTPFFIEEVVQALVEEGVLQGTRGDYALAGDLPALEVPPTVQGVIAARIDRLPERERALLQRLAVIGRTFALPLVHAVCDESDNEVMAMLRVLCEREFVYERHEGGTPGYLFKHALTQDVAYEGLLHARRRVLHERTARAIEQLYAASLDEHLAELAHHYARSDATAEAVDYLHRAGTQAVGRAAYSDADGFLARAVDLLPALPSSAERDQRELALHTELGSVRLSTQGYVSSQVEQHYARAVDLCMQSENDEELVPALAGLFLVQFLRGAHENAQRIAERALSVAETTGTAGDRLTAHYMLSQNLPALGEFDRAGESQRQVAALYEPAEHHVLADRFAEDPGAISLGFEAVTLFIRGYPEQAVERAREANALATALQHDASLAQTLFWSAVVSIERREFAATRIDTERSLKIAARFALGFITLFVNPVHGVALMNSGDPDSGIALIRSSVAQYLEHDARFYAPFYRLHWASAEVACGRVTEALAIIDDALADATVRGELKHVAELHRVRGECLLQARADDAEAMAERCFLEALEVARAQGAKSWELRAVTSLARLWQRQGREREARERLQAVYDWFTEGFETADLRDARTLIDSLSRA